MTSVREAIVLPCIFLTVTLTGGLRIAGTVRLVPPSVVALLLGMALLGTLARAGALAPDRLMHATRNALENVSGLMVIATLFAASAQIFNLLTPEHGLLFAIFSLYFFIQLMTTLAGVTSRTSLLRSLTVLFAAAFVLRFVVLESMYAPEGGLLKRLTTALLQGVSLGAIEYQPNAPGTGYAGFFTLVLFMVGLLLLPSRRQERGENANRLQTTIPGHVIVPVLAVGLIWPGCGGGVSGREHQAGERGPAVHREPHHPETDRDDALRAARVWHAPRRPIADVDFTANPPDSGGFLPSEVVSCRFLVRAVSGTTPKFQCELPDGRIVKVKYGANAELHAEVAATRLLDALGFGADRMYVVRGVQCAGCPRFPFHALKCSSFTGLERPCLGTGVDPTHITIFRTAVVERPMDGTPIGSDGGSGWSWFELDRIDAARGGSARAEVDALRLLAVVLAHWDNKAANQRLICPAGRERPGGGCSEPLAMIQDLGATFGPLKLDLHNWSTTPVWADHGSCTVSMKTMPYAGGTFPDRQISESGRVLLAGLLQQVTARQLTDLFTSSRMVEFDQVSGEGRDAEAWTKAFQDKVSQIADTHPCPA
jgi:hypothetical protein